MTIVYVVSCVVKGDTSILGVYSDVVVAKNFTDQFIESLPIKDPRWTSWKFDPHWDVWTRFQVNEDRRYEIEPFDIL